MDDGYSVMDRSGNSIANVNDVYTKPIEWSRQLEFDFMNDGLESKKSDHDLPIEESKLENIVYGHK